MTELLHALQRTAETAGHGDVTTGQGRGRLGRIHLQQLHLVCIDLEIVEHSQKFVVCDIADGRGNLLAFQVLGIGLSNPRIIADHAIVVRSVGYGSTDEFQRQPLGHGDHERNQSLRIGDLHVARGHCRRHFVAVAERAPVDLHAHLLVEGAVGLVDQVRRWPFEEIGDCNLVQCLCRSC